MPFNRYLNNFKYKNVDKIPARMQKIAARPRYSICRKRGEQNHNAPPESGEFL